VRCAPISLEGMTDQSSDVEDFYRLLNAVQIEVLQGMQTGLAMGGTIDQFNWRMSKLSSIFIVGELTRRRIRATPERRDAIVREALEVLEWSRGRALAGPPSHQPPPYPIVPLGKVADAELEQRWANLAQQMHADMLYPPPTHEPRK